MIIKIYHGIMCIGSIIFASYGLYKLLKNNNKSECDWKWEINQENKRRNLTNVNTLDLVNIVMNVNVYLNQKNMVKWPIYLNKNIYIY